MYLKKELYPKTMRVPVEQYSYVITEKLDGSNLIVGKKYGKIVIATRTEIFDIDTYMKSKSPYKGLVEWLEKHYNELHTDIYEGSFIAGEWYKNSTLYMFGKLNVDEKWNITNLIYDQELFKYVFNNKKVPKYISTVPVVAKMSHFPNIQELDTMYDEYTVGKSCKVEGFIISDIRTNIVQKYVRFKRKKFTPHTD